MGSGDRTVSGSTLPTGQRQGAPGPGREIDEESMSTGIRELVVGWGGASEAGDDEERLAAIRKGPRFARPAVVEPPPETSHSE